MRNTLFRTIAVCVAAPALAGQAPASKPTRPTGQARPAAAPPRTAAPAKLELQPGLKRAKEELTQGRVVEAAQLYRQLADQHRSVQALLGLARIQSGVGDARGAIDVLEKARQLAPNSEEVLNALARVALAARSPVIATRALEALARMVPSVMENQYLLGVALMQAGDMPSGAMALEEARRLEPNRALTLVALGFAYNGQKLYAEARPHLLRALEIDGSDVEALAALSESEEGLGELEAAERHAQRALARDEKHAIANLVLGLVRMKQQRYEEARAALEKAVATDPSSAKSQYQLSLACARLGDEAGQKRHLDLYMKAQKENAERLRDLQGAAGTSRGGM
jgi:tetratricopeptide (TPR) repeat protein